MSVRFAVLADTHYHPAAPKDFAPPKLLTQGPEILAATVPAVNALRPDFILHVGDLLCGGGSFELTGAQYEQSLADVAAAYERFSAPVYCVPGNHDCDAQACAYGDFIDTFRAPKPFDVIDIAPGLRLARAHVFSDGEADGGTWTARLDTALRKADHVARQEGVALLFMLHPWIRPGTGPSPTKGVITNAGRLQQALAECVSVVATFSGHRHANRLRVTRDYISIDTACLIGYPLGFRMITITEDAWLTATWHTLDMPSVGALAEALGSVQDKEHWAGEFGDRNNTVLLPRMRALQA